MTVSTKSITKRVPTKAPTPRVYSYNRFSTLPQDEGDSERRQIEGAQAWVAKKGYVLDDELTMLDKGFSGYSGKHRTKGALGKFLEKVKHGLVPSGSILLVEHIDRLSREGVENTLRKIIFELWDHNITLQTLSPEETYEPGCGGSPKFLALMLYMQAAWDASKRKSDLLRSTFAQTRKKLQEGLPGKMGRSPAWLKQNSDGSFEAIPEAAATINLIFKMKLEGLSVPVMHRRLNAECTWMAPKGKRARASRGWARSYMQKLLTDRSVLGEYQPHITFEGKRVKHGEPIRDRYPAIVKTQTFYAVQKMMQANRRKGGRVGAATNLFKHLPVCAYCGGPMHLEKRAEPRKLYLYCANGRVRLGCTPHRVRYEETEKLLLENCPRLRPDQVLPNQREQTKLVSVLQQRVVGLTEEIESLETQIENLIDRIGRTLELAIGNRYQKRAEQLESEKLEKTKQLEIEQQALRTAEISSESFRVWQADLASLQEALTTGNIEVRLKLQAHVREFIEKIEVFSVGHRKLHDDEAEADARVAARKRLEKTSKDGLWLNLLRDPEVKEAADGDSLAKYLVEAIAEANPGFKLDKQFHAFLRELTARRMSREGRFIRVHFKSGAVVDLVPPGSLASGVAMKADKKNWKPLSPDIEKAWQKFLKASYQAIR